MRNSIEDLIQQCDHFLQKGELDKSLEIMTQLYQLPNLADKDRLYVKNLEIYLYLSYGMFNKAENITDDLYKFSISLKNTFYQILALIGKMEVFLPQEKIDESAKILEQAKPLFKILEKEKNPNHDKLLAKIMYIEGTIYLKKDMKDEARIAFQKCIPLMEKNNPEVELLFAIYNLGVTESYAANYKVAFEILQKALALSEKLENHVSRGWILAHLGWLYYNQGELEQALEYAHQSNSIELLKKNIHFEEFSTTILAQCYWGIGELDKALENFKKNLVLRESRGNKLQVAHSLNSVGGIYKQKGEIKRALTYYNRILEIKEAMEDPNVSPLFLISLGNCYGELGEIDIAQSYLDKAASLYDKTGDKTSISKCYHYLISIHLNQMNVDIAKLYLSKQYELFIQYPENKYINQLYRIDKALIQKNNTRLVDKMQAQQTFKEIAEEAVVDHEYTIESMINLCDLLIYELKVTGEENILNEIKELSAEMLDIAKKQQSFSLLAETYFFQSQLELIELKIDQSRQLLTKAQEIAEEKGLNLLASRISYEHDALIDQMDKWEEIIKKEMPLQERLQYSHHEFIFSRMIREKIPEIVEPSEEIPIALLIMASNGVNIFNKRFVNHDSEDVLTISNFLSSISLFIREIFASHGYIDRIKHGDNMIIIRSNENFMIGYIFKGQSYNAVKKLDAFIHNIREKHNIWSELIDSSKNGKILDDNRMVSVSTICDQIFI